MSSSQKQNCLFRLILCLSSILILFSAGCVSSLFKSDSEDPDQNKSAGLLSPADDPLRQKALAGDVNAQFLLADEYFYGSDTRKANQDLAAYWYFKAAEQGLPEAQFNYGICLEQGLGVRKNPYRAAEYYQRAANAKFLPASHRFALILYYGIPEDPSATAAAKPPFFAIQQSEQEALKRLDALAEQDFTPSMVELAEILLRQSRKLRDAYHNNSSVPQNALLPPDATRPVTTALSPVTAPSPEEIFALEEKAFKLLLHATRKADAPGKAFRLLADCYQSGCASEKADPVKMIQALEQAAAKNDSEAVMKLAYTLEQGLNGTPDLEKAFQYYKKAAKAALPFAQFKYAEGILEDREKGRGLSDALELLHAAADAGLPQAIFKLAGFAEKGIGETPDFKKALELYAEAAKRGLPEAQYRFALFFESGAEPLKKDEKAAFFWFSEAAGRAYPPAQRKLALMYANGDGGCERNPTEALRLLRLAAQNGDPEAAFLLERMEERRERLRR